MSLEPSPTHWPAIVGRIETRPTIPYSRSFSAENLDFVNSELRKGAKKVAKWSKVAVWMCTVRVRAEEVGVRP